MLEKMYVLGEIFNKIAEGKPVICATNFIWIVKRAVTKDANQMQRYRGTLKKSCLEKIIKSF